jgi:WD40 repeat protein
MAASRDGASVLIGGVDLGTTAWRLPAGTLAFGLAPPPPLVVPGPEGVRPHPEAPTAYATSPDGRELVVAVEHRLLRYDVASGRLIAELPAVPRVVRAVAWSPDGASLLVSRFYDAAARLVRAGDGTEVRAFPVAREAASVAFTPDGRTVAVGTDDGVLLLFAVGSAAPARRVALGRGTVQALAPAGGLLAAAGDDGQLRLVDPARGTVVATVDAGTPVARLAAGAGVVASAGIDGAVRLHDTADGQVRVTLAWHRSQVLGLAWAAGVLVSGDLDGQVALWDVSFARRPDGSGSAP